MRGHEFDTVTRGAADGIIRRRSLLTLGGGALAITLAGSQPTQAGKDGKKAKKRAKKKCKRQVDACRDAITERCLGNPQCEDDLEELLPCCSLLSNCNAGASLDCFFFPPPE